MSERAMQRLRMTASALVVSAVLVLVATSCQDPTEIVVEVRTNVPYRPGLVTAFTVGALGGVELADSSTETHEPWGADGFVGSLVLVPETSKSASVSVKVVMGLRRSTRECVGPAYAGCIVARRTLSYLAHERLVLPIVLYATCEDLACDPNTTCSALGQCVSSSIDPSTCSGVDGCVLPGDPKPGSPADAQAPADESPSCGTASPVLTDDPLNCGACGKVCKPFETCNGSGACECLAGLLACDGVCRGQNDRNSCGRCDNRCTTFSSCSSRGTCEGACNGEGTPCPSDPGYVSCVDLTKDPFHCGACGVSCRSGEVCIKGACRRTTPSPTCTTACGSPTCCATAFAATPSACCPPIGSRSQHVMCVTGIDAADCPQR